MEERKAGGDVESLTQLSESKGNFERGEEESNGTVDSVESFKVGEEDRSPTDSFSLSELERRGEWGINPI